jgi:hypothetical protein
VFDEKPDMDELKRMVDGAKEVIDGVYASDWACLRIDDDTTIEMRFESTGIEGEEEKLGVVLLLVSDEKSVALDLGESCEVLDELGTMFKAMHKFYHRIEMDALSGEGLRKFIEQVGERTEPDGHGIRVAGTIGEGIGAYNPSGDETGMGHVEQGRGDNGVGRAGAGRGKRDKGWN